MTTHYGKTPCCDYYYPAVGFKVRLKCLHRHSLILHLLNIEQRYYLCFISQALFKSRVCDYTHFKHSAAFYLHLINFRYSGTKTSPRPPPQNAAYGEKCSKALIQLIYGDTWRRKKNPAALLSLYRLNLPSGVLLDFIRFDFIVGTGVWFFLEIR